VSSGVHVVLGVRAVGVCIVMDLFAQ